MANCHFFPEYVSQMSQSYTFPPILGYHLREKIGGGGFSKVYLAIHTEQKRYAAVKVVTLSVNSDQSYQKRILREVKVHQALKNRNIIELIGSHSDDGSSARIPALFIVLEYAEGGDLFDKIPPDVGLPEKVAHFYFTQLIKGLAFVHSNGVCHRDIKPENLLLDGRGNLKLSDFGLCSVFKYRGEERMLGDICGSPPYVAPELALGRKYRAEPIDVWSCGVVLFALLVGNTPWDEPTPKSPEYAAYLGGRLFGTSPWNRISRPAFDLLSQMLTVDPATRISLAGVQRALWFSQKNDLLDSDFQCADPPRLGSEMGARMAMHGHFDVPQAEYLLSPSQHPALSMDVDSSADSGVRLSQAAMTQAQADPGTAFSSTMAFYSGASSLAPSQRANPNYTRFFTHASPLECQRAIVAALKIIGAQYELTQGSETVASGDEISIGLVDRKRQPLKGHAQFKQENGGLVVNLARSKGNPMEWRRVYHSILGKLPEGMVVAR